MENTTFGREVRASVWHVGLTVGGITAVLAAPYVVGPVASGDTGVIIATAGLALWAIATVAGFLAANIFLGEVPGVPVFVDRRVGVPERRVHYGTLHDRRRHPFETGRGACGAGRSGVFERRAMAG